MLPPCQFQPSRTWRHRSKEIAHRPRGEAKSDSPAVRTSNFMSSRSSVSRFNDRQKTKTGETAIPVHRMQDEEMHHHTYCDLLQYGLEEGVVLGKIAKNFLILGKIDENRESILGDALSRDSRQLRC